MVKDFDWRQPRSFFFVVWNTIKNPKQFFEALPPSRDLISPLLFLVLVHAIPSLAKLLIGMNPIAVGHNLAGNILRSLIFFGFLYTLGHHVMRNPLPLSGFLRIYAYGCGVWVISALVPFLTTALGLPLQALLVFYSLALLFLGLRYTAKLSFLMAVACLMLSVVGMMLLMSLVGDFSVMPAPPGANTGAV